MTDKKKKREKKKKKNESYFDILTHPNSSSADVFEVWEITSYFVEGNTLTLC